MPAKRKTQDAHHIVLMVHPLFSIFHLLWYGHSPLPGRFPAENLRFLMGQWGQRIRAAAANPNAIVVYLDFSEKFFLKGLKERNGTADYARSLDWFSRSRKMLSRFRAFTTRTLGRRLIQLNGSAYWEPHTGKFRVKTLERSLRERDIRLSTQANVHAFGEYITRCVSDAVETLRVYPHDPNKSSKKKLPSAGFDIRSDPFASLAPWDEFKPHAESEHRVSNETNNLGTLYSNLRRNAAKLRRKSRVRLH